VPCLSGFAPVHLRMLQVIRHVAVIRSRPRFICAERGHCRSEQTYQCAPTGSRQSLLNDAAPTRTAMTGGNPDLGSACPQGVNGRGPPPTLTLTIESANSGIVVTRVG
jgi:hypothetical protein